jgi:NAD(P) transhydrogenase subunit beta
MFDIQVYKKWHIPGIVIGGLVLLAFFSPSLSKLLGVALSMIFCVLAFASLSSLKTAQHTLLWAGMSFGCAALSFLASAPLDHIEGIAPIGLGALVGIGMTRSAQMIHLPQLMAFFHALVGLATALLTIVLLVYHTHSGEALAFHTAFELSIGGVMAAITFTGSIVAALKLQGWTRFMISPLLTDKRVIMGTALCTFLLSLLFWGWPALWVLSLLLLAASVFGAVGVLPIGGADMPVVISLLNSCSGWAALGIGFSLHHPLFIVVGSIVGFSGAVLSYSMCKGMNRSLWDVLWPSTPQAFVAQTSQRAVQSLSPEDAGFMLSSSEKVIIIPGYGMASAQAQHALRELSDELKAKGIQVRYAIHPVAGRMPGHMNVLLAEANISYDDIFEYEDICADFSQADVALVIGANDIVNSLAKTDPASSIYGMPVFPVEKARSVLFIKRSMAPGYAGLDNPLFYEPNTFMIFGDAKKVCEGIIKSL